MGQNMNNSKLMWEIYILIDFDKNGTNGHQMDQIIGETVKNKKKLNF